MFCPLVDEQVRVSDRTDLFIVLSVDRAAGVADVHPVADPAAIESSVPFRLLFAASECGPAEAGRYSWEGRLEGSRLLLRSAQVHMDRAFKLLAELQTSLVTTMEAIRTSQILIQVSDRVIARAQTLDCGQDGSGENG